MFVYRDVERNKRGGQINRQRVMSRISPGQSSWNNFSREKVKDNKVVISSNRDSKGLYDASIAGRMSI